MRSSTQPIAKTALLDQGKFKTEIAAELGIARSTVYRLIEEIESEKEAA